jgi:hypothetical protein
MLWFWVALCESFCIKWSLAERLDISFARYFQQITQKSFESSACVRVKKIKFEKMKLVSEKLKILNVKKI